MRSILISAAVVFAAMVAPTAGLAPDAEPASAAVMLCAASEWKEARSCCREYVTVNGKRVCVKYGECPCTGAGCGGAVRG